MSRVHSFVVSDGKRGCDWLGQGAYYKYLLQVPFTKRQHAHLERGRIITVWE